MRALFIGGSVDNSELDLDTDRPPLHYPENTGGGHARYRLHHVGVGIGERLHHLVVVVEGDHHDAVAGPGAVVQEVAQTAEDELMPFPILDACLHLYAAEKMSPDEVAQALVSLFPETTEAQARAFATRFTRLFTTSIYKWVQSPLSLHVGSLDLERERALQMPVVQKTEWN